ncbi:cytochrome C552 [Paramagnetospirillum kuznetsovii]|uniref:Cytochrome C552 n=1 Tax=Paramagnetospirillum kuznetsovii TaxID=2053833 RepID=A0A364P1T2_9PROT|nr:cytochrome c [Paramagnetospirillum kuznetsovii]RAU23284.1 cytochrome C552 [Paramagnetospirillum kuznetsovii]
MLPRFSALPVLAFTALLSCGAWAAEGGREPRPQGLEKGKWIAEVLCSNCHLIAPLQRKSATDAAPPFAWIAQSPSTTEASLAAFLSAPHGKMPDLVLSRGDIRDVSAYILSLRQAQ